MKTKVLTSLALALALALPSSAAAADDTGAAMIVDVVIARPAGFAATVVGSAFFVLALPFALASKSVDKAAESLVVKPARVTFTRPLGDFDMLKENTP